MPLFVTKWQIVAVNRIAPIGAIAASRGKKHGAELDVEQVVGALLSNVHGQVNRCAIVVSVNTTGAAGGDIGCLLVSDFGGARCGRSVDVCRWTRGERPRRL